jgi:hypothetical protein
MIKVIMVVRVSDLAIAVTNLARPWTLIVAYRSQVAEP